MRLTPRFFIPISVAALIFIAAFVYAATFSDNTQADFDAGVYSNTEYSSGGIRLIPGQTSGSFVSRVFDAGESVSWSRLAWSQNLPSSESIFAVDVAADVWRSTDQGANWSLSANDYNGGTANSATAMAASASGRIFILHNQAVWSSADLGSSWSNISADYNSSEAQNGTAMTVDGNGYIYIPDADEDLWRSIDNGVSWTKQSLNFNGGSGNVLGMTAIGSAIYAVDAAAGVWHSADGGANWTQRSSDYNGASGNLGTDGMANDGSRLFIAQNQSIWVSADGGNTWTQAISDYNASEGQDAVTIAVDSSDRVYIIEADEEVWRSTDAGLSWTKVSADINGGNGNVAGMAVVNVASSLTFSVRSGDTNPPAGGFSGSYTNSSGSSIVVADARYFQYQASFSSADPGSSPSFSSATVTYGAGGGEPPEPDSTIQLPVGTPGGVRPTTAVFSGRAYPGAKISVLHKSDIGQAYRAVPLVISKIDAKGNFEISIVGLLQAKYILALVAEDKYGTRTGVVPVEFDFVSNDLLKVENMLLPPTINLPEALTAGGMMTVSGYAGPEEKVEIYLDNALAVTVTTESDGAYSYSTSTKIFSAKTHSARARRVSSNGEMSDFSLLRPFRISPLRLPAADFNSDDSIDVMDWSIFLFRWHSTDKSMNKTTDFNRDGRTDIADFSIFLEAFPKPQMLQ